MLCRVRRRGQMIAARLLLGERDERVFDLLKRRQDARFVFTCGLFLALGLNLEIRAVLLTLQGTLR